MTLKHSKMTICVVVSVVCVAVLRLKWGRNAHRWVRRFQKNNSRMTVPKLTNTRTSLALRVSVGKPEGWRQLGREDVQGEMLLKWTLKT
jgi:hypothetical protein